MVHMKHSAASLSKHAFSLVELSIVLVILGLLVGGVLSGQSLIRAAELRAVSTEYSRYTAAIGSFRDKYFAIPGDMANATQFWGTGTCPGTSATPSTGTATCNGNGNGQITILATGTDAYGNTYGNEVFRAWHHLANAGLIEGSYWGVPNSATANNLNTVLGSNAPKSRMSNTGWSLYNLDVIPISNTSYFDGNYGNTLIVGAVATNSITNSWNSLKPEEAWNVDTKFDDGKPATGSVTSLEVHGGNTGSSNCSDLAASNSASLTASVYLLNYTSPACALVFKTGY